MSPDEPQWWYPEPDRRESAWPSLLTPVSRVVAAAARRRLTRTGGYASRLPVICIGNLTVGGTGKTPMTRLIVEMLLKRGEVPVILSRGYGGREAGPILVDPAAHRARDVGDEPLLLSRTAPVVVSRDRRQGARFIERMGEQSNVGAKPSVILMDDGLQNSDLVQDLTIAIVDARRGLGNGRVLPAGPLRADLADQARRISVIVVNGEKDPARATPGLADLVHEVGPVPVLSSRTVPVGDTHWLYDEPVIAYAGIANPRRFFSLLKALDAKVLEEVALADHEPFTTRMANRLLDLSKARSARLVTTEKDLARLANEQGLLGDLAAASRAVAIATRIADFDAARLETLLRDTIGHVRSLER